MRHHDKVLLRTCTQFASSEGWVIRHVMDDPRCRQIGLPAFAAHLPIEHWRVVQEGLLYETGPRKGLHIKDDFHVTYYKASFLGFDCVVMRHSAIEFFFLRPADHEPALQAVAQGEPSN